MKILKVLFIVLTIILTLIVLIILYFNTELHDFLLICAILVALFSERIWKFYGDRRKRKLLKTTVIQCLENFISDMNRIIYERNSPINEDSQIEYKSTSQSEVSHYYILFTDLIVPNITTLHLDSISKTIKFFDHYKKNIEKANSEGHLRFDTSKNLLEYANDAIQELK